MLAELAWMAAVVFTTVLSATIATAIGVGIVLWAMERVID